ncbi:HAD family hydrolase [Micromonosporaceae bacterium Da 78-11]
MPERYRAILLDLYGTLVRDDEDDREAEIAAEVARLAGVAADAVAQQWSTRIWAMADDAHGPGFRSLADLTLDSLAATATHFGVRVDPRRFYREPWSLPPLFADSRPFLDAVDVPVCLVSDADRDEFDRVLAGHGIVVAGAVTSEDARAYKPRPEPFRLALDHLGLTPADVLHIGDSPASDIAGATALGIHTAYLSRGGRCLPAHLTATYTVDSLTALLPLATMGTVR